LGSVFHSSATKKEKKVIPLTQFLLFSQRTHDIGLITNTLKKKDALAFLKILSRSIFQK